MITLTYEYLPDGEMGRAGSRYESKECPQQRPIHRLEVMCYLLLDWRRKVVAVEPNKIVVEEKVANKGTRRWTFAGNAQVEFAILLKAVYQYLQPSPDDAVLFSQVEVILHDLGVEILNLSDLFTQAQRSVGRVPLAYATALGVSEQSELELCLDIDSKTWDNLVVAVERWLDDDTHLPSQTLEYLGRDRK